jgi:hypothetical protein
MRVIIEKPPKECSLPKVIEKLKEYPNFNLRYCPDLPKAVIGIFDGKKIIFDTRSSGGLGECPALWSKNRCIVAAMHDYYEILWRKSLKEPQYHINEEQVQNVHEKTSHDPTEEIENLTSSR